MKISVTGANGRVGRQLVKLGCLPLLCDVTDYYGVSQSIKNEKPDIVVHLASLSDVDWCEKKEHQTEVINVNFKGAVNVATACRENRIGMVLLSTDHVFNGKRGPYKENYHYYTPNLIGQYEKPVNFYGLSKVAAEGIQRVFPHVKIVRTSHLFDAKRMEAAYPNAEGFPIFLLRSFMYVNHFAESFRAYLDRFYEMPDILHISGSATISWYEFMLAYASVFQLDKEYIVPRRKEIKGIDMAPRPHKAGLDTHLSAKLRLPQNDYLQGLKQMYSDEHS